MISICGAKLPQSRDVEHKYLREGLHNLWAEVPLEADRAHNQFIASCRRPEFTEGN